MLTLLLDGYKTLRYMLANIGVNDDKLVNKLGSTELKATFYWA